MTDNPIRTAAKSQAKKMNYRCSTEINSRYYGLSLIRTIILLHEKFLQFYWLRAVVFQLNLKYLHVKITNVLWVVV